MARRMYRGNSLATTLNSNITAAQTSFTVTVNGGATFPDGSAGPFVCTLNLGGTTEEKVLVGTRAGDTFSNVTRGYDGTSAASHTAGEGVRHTISAVDMDEANAHVNATTVSDDPHPQYLTPVEGAAAYSSIGHTHSKTIRIPHTFTISGAVQVASGDTYYVPPFFVSLPAGQTAVIAGARHRIHSGTSATWTVSHGAADAGTSVTGLTTVASSTTTAMTSATGANALSDGDAVQLVITGISGSPQNLSVTVYLDVTV